MDRDIPGLRLIDAIFANKAFARDTAGRLGRISNALETLGMMPHVVVELDLIAEDMHHMAETIAQAHGDVQSEQMHHNAGMTASLLELAFVVVPERAELAERRARDAV